MLCFDSYANSLRSYPIVNNSLPLSMTINPCQSTTSGLMLISLHCFHAVFPFSSPYTHTHSFSRSFALTPNREQLYLLTSWTPSAPRDMVGSSQEIERCGALYPEHHIALARIFLYDAIYIMGGGESSMSRRAKSANHHPHCHGPSFLSHLCNAQPYSNSMSSTLPLSTPCNLRSSEPCSSY